MVNRDYVRLQHILDASQAAVSHLTQKYREELDDNRLLLNGIVRELEILGEAASQISGTAREQLPSLPWREMVGLRNRLIHGYFDVNIQFGSTASADCAVGTNRSKLASIAV